MYYLYKFHIYVNNLNWKLDIDKLINNFFLQIDNFCKEWELIAFLCQSHLEFKVLKIYYPKL